MASPNVDTNSNCIKTYNNWSGGTSFSNGASVWKTSGANQLALAVLSYEGMASAGQVDTFTVTQGGDVRTFTLIPGARIQGNGGAVGRQTIEVWQCAMATQFNSGGATVTTALTNSVAIDDGMITLLSIQGLADINSPLDPNVLAIVVGVNTASAPPPTLTYSTSKADDLLIFVSAAIQTSNSVNPSGWTQHVNTFNGGGSLFESQMVCSKQVSSTQTSQTVQDASASNFAHWSAAFLAFTADASTTDSVGSVALDIAVAGTGLAGGVGVGSVALNIASAGVGASTARAAGTVGLNIAIAATNVSIAAGAGSVAIGLAVTGVGQALRYGAGDISLNLNLVGRAAAVDRSAGVVDLAITVAGGGSHILGSSGAIALNVDVTGFGAIGIVCSTPVVLKI